MTVERQFAASNACQQFSEASGTRASAVFVCAQSEFGKNLSLSFFQKTWTFFRENGFVHLHTLLAAVTVGHLLATSNACYQTQWNEHYFESGIAHGVYVSRASLQEVEFQLFVRKLKLNFFQKRLWSPAHSTNSRNSPTFADDQQCMLPFQWSERYFVRVLA